ncbi:Pentachlorophenol 4-monooxygenase [Legionella massiliensis]|uniref:Pentachlorophenol 4-monooxygenase n=1 Tax=Legionella massiliensis TaxID=1034943 RepID=A0A078KU86_9GAMM|nr:FAD-dependent monooxygenase [Legionella massiliensis]CDZ76547.1 Pentachlorophenol 4-monooxygenase [Legionella massiliensis]CEE12285.1 Pentachlorophenol 4-monooxygenase [Legionella massiliensis]
MSNEALDVLVVGAGPVGLFCANELTRHGLPCRLIDKKPTITDKSKALALHIRTLDLLKDCGFLDEVFARGHKVDGIILKSKEKQLMDNSFTILEADYNFLIDLAQDQTEHILYEGLRGKGLDVEWNTELTNIEQQSARVLATLEKNDGNSEQIEASWVIACDGSHSTLRELVKAPFIGSSYKQTWWLADLFIDWDLPENKMVGFTSDEGPMVCFPMGKKRYRIVMTAPEKIEYKDPTMTDIEEAFSRRCSEKATLSNPIWLSQFGIAHKQIDQYRYNRVFFAGDAAHVHSPMGGQGMNTGLQDIYNLAWKLAMVHKGQAREQLLDSYHLERFPIAQAVLQKTGLMTRMIMLRNPLLIRLRNQFLHLVTSLKPVRMAILKDVSELDLSYAKSPIVTELGTKTKFKIGEFLLDFNLTEAQTKEKKSFRDLTQGTEHHLLLFAGRDNGQLEPLIKTASAIEEHYSGLIKTHLILANSNEQGIQHSSLWFDNNQDIHKRFAINEATAILLRPDKYIGLSQMPLNKDDLLRQLEKGYINKANNS